MEWINFTTVVNQLLFLHFTFQPFTLSCYIINLVFNILTGFCLLEDKIDVL